MLLYTHKQGSWLLYPHKPQWESKNTPAMKTIEFSVITHTHTHFSICTHKDAQHSERHQEHNHTLVSSHNREHRAGERNKCGNEGKTEWEAEVRTKRDVRREAGDDEWEGTQLSCCNGFQQGCFVSLASLLLKGSQILPSVPQTHSVILL